jgi:mRNA-degrading endonuclease RelE of RelBE toxin-antitoxin system
MDILPLTLRRLAFRICSLPDTGWFGLTPLRTHVLVCGGSRSGTTLLKLLLEVAMPRARRFRREIRAWRAATSRLRNHEVMITKRPRDVDDLPRIRELYAGRRTQLRIIIMIRDPRDILTSSHVKSAHERPYHISIPEWNHSYEHVIKHSNDPDVMLVRYEDLVTNTGPIESRLESFIGERFEQPFSSFVDRVPTGFETRALNGLRPIDAHGIARWRRPEHRERIEQLLRELPDFPQQIVQLGYERDREWVGQWRLALLSNADVSDDWPPVGAPRRIAA